MELQTLVIIFGGIFSITCAAFNFDWFMNARKAQFFVKILTRTGARIFYIILGIGLITLGILLSTKTIH